MDGDGDGRDARLPPLKNVLAEHFFEDRRMGYGHVDYNYNQQGGTLASGSTTPAPMRRHAQHEDVETAPMDASVAGPSHDYSYLYPQQQQQHLQQEEQHQQASGHTQKRSYGSMVDGAYGFGFGPSSESEPPAFAAPPGQHSFQNQNESQERGDEYEGDEGEGENEDEEEGGDEENGLEKRHGCPCGKAFNRPSSLRIHQNTHTGEKPFVCPFPGCGRSFNVSSNMRRHYRNHVRTGQPITGAGLTSLPGVEQAAQDNIFVFDGRQPFMMPFDLGRTPAQPYPARATGRHGRGQEPLTPPYTTEGSSRNVPVKAEDRTNFANAGIPTYQQQYGQQQARPQATFQYQTPNATMHSPGYAVESSTTRIQHPPLQVQIPTPPTIPRINMPSIDVPSYPLGPALSRRPSRSPSRERPHYRISPNISRPPSSMRGPSPIPSSASTSGRMPYASTMPLAQSSSSSLLLPNSNSHHPPGLHSPDPAQFVQYISQQTQAYTQQLRVPSPLPGAGALSYSYTSMGMGSQQHSPSASGSPYPPLTPVTPIAYSPFVPDAGHSAYQLAQQQQQAASACGGREVGGYPSPNVYAGQFGGGGLSEVHAHTQKPAMGSHSPLSEQYAGSGYAQRENASVPEKKIGLGINLVPPQPSPCEANSQPTSPHPHPNPPDSEPVSASASIFELAPASTSSPPDPEAASRTPPAAAAKPTKKGAKAPSGRPRGRPKGSKNKTKPKVSVSAPDAAAGSSATGTSTPASNHATDATTPQTQTQAKGTRRSRGRPRKYPLPQAPTTATTTTTVTVDVAPAPAGTAPPDARAFTFVARDDGDVKAELGGVDEAELDGYAVRASRLVKLEDGADDDGDAEGEEDVDADAEGDDDDDYVPEPEPPTKSHYRTRSSGVNNGMAALGGDAGPRKRARQGSVRS